MHTSVAIDKKDFEYFLAEDNLHIAITLKDFKAVIAHAESAHSTITARYTRPTRPLQLAYDFGGVKTEFTLMTTGDSDSDIPDSSHAPELSARHTPAPANVSRVNVTSNTSHMPPPRARSIRPLTGTPGASVRGTGMTTESQRPPPASIQFDSLFVPADDDRQWDVPNDEEEEEAEDRLGWDATGDQVWQIERICSSSLLIKASRHSTRVSLPACEIMSPVCLPKIQVMRKIWVYPRRNVYHR